MSCVVVYGVIRLTVSSDPTGTPYHSGFCNSCTGLRSNKITYIKTVSTYISVSLCSVAVLCNSCQLSSCFPREPTRSARYKFLDLDSSSAFLPHTPSPPFISIFFSLSESIHPRHSSKWRWRNPLRSPGIEGSLRSPFGILHDAHLHR